MDAQKGFLRSIGALVSEKGATLLLVADTPYLKGKGRDCLTDFTLCATPLEEAVWYQWPERSRLQDAVALSNAAKIRVLMSFDLSP